MSLERKLQAAAEPWLDEETLPEERASALERLIGRRRRAGWTRRLGAVAAAAAAVGGVLFWPVVVSVASGTPVIGPYIARMAKYDEGAHWADQKGYVVPVNRSSTDQGLTFRVESVLADSARTVFYFVIEGEGLSEERGSIRFDHIRFNKRSHGMATSGRWEFADGRFVGEYQTGPLPTPVSVIDLHLAEAAGVKGDWHVSFMASRADLDKLSRTIVVDQPLQGDGYDLTINKLLLAPTQTIVEVTGSLAAETEIRKPELRVDGVPVKWQGTSSETGTDGTVSFRFQFDRVDPQAASELVFSIAEKVRLVAKGPVLELKPGARAEFGDLWFEYLSVATTPGGDTEIVARVPWTDPAWFKHGAIENWVVVNEAGQIHNGQVGVWPGGDGTARLVVTVEGKVEGPVRLVAGRSAEPIHDEAEVRIPLK